MFSFVCRTLFGSSNDRYIKRHKAIIAQINAFEEAMQAIPEGGLAARLAEYRAEVDNGRSLNKILPEVFALVRETSRRVLNMRHYDVQLIGGIVLHEGKIAEMKTGEGKTLVATLPVVLNALSGKGVHVVTVNDYLAKRDAAWMGTLYEALGLSTGVIVHGLNDEERKAAYQSDITYGTNNEFGFDYLRDNMKMYADQLVQRKHNFAIVDEVDSILVDEARTPLIISGASDESTGLYNRIDQLVRKLKVEVEYTIDEKARTAMLTEEGVARAEELLGIDNLYDSANIAVQHHVSQALKAHTVFRRDTDYLVDSNNQVVIVDEFTGRPMPGRRYSDGLHQALEAKEGVRIEAENQTLASITFQNYFRMYEKLSGMTGTADTEAVEFRQIYNLEVISIPPNRPLVRKDFADQVYRTRKEKFQAIVESIQDLYVKRQPVLVGTISIETSEYISGMLQKMDVPHRVLNAKHHEHEADIVAQAGQAGHVTIATNMAGRGTDIVLGEGVTALGGLHILGTERHESRRIDNQLRGRSGRQGDPGSSRFYLSLEDDLMRLFGSERLSSIMQRLGMQEGEPIENAMVSRAIENAQKRVEGHNFEIRKTLLDYDNVMNQQREVIYTLRRELMGQEDLEPVAAEFLDDLLADIYAPLEGRGEAADAELVELTRARLRDVMNIGRVLAEDASLPSEDEARALVLGMLDELRAQGGPMYRDILRYFLLGELDRCWKEHLRDMDHLRDGIGLQGYAQRDPKIEYKKQGFQLFQALIMRIREGAFRAFTRLRIEKQPEEEDFQLKKDVPEAPAPGTIPVSGVEVRTEPKIGRNDLCPCGSGKKYKKCCGMNA